MDTSQLVGFSQGGRARYLLTIRTRERRRAFCDDAIVATTLRYIRRIASEETFAVLAYCLMPDYALLLVEAETPGASVRRFVQRAKHYSGAAYSRRCRQPLWQNGYCKQQLRQDTDVREVARYILWNPVREGLTQTPAEYPYLGSYVWSVEDLIE